MADTVADAGLLRLTPEEEAQLVPDTAAPAEAPAVDVFKDFTDDELVKLSVEDKSFDMPAIFKQREDLWGDAGIVSKVASAHNKLRQRGFELSDLPGPAEAAAGIWGFGKGLLKQVSGYLPIHGSADKQQRAIAENWAGTEQAVTGLGHMAQKAVGKALRATYLAPSLETYSEKQKVEDLWDAVGKAQVSEEISKGKGAFMTAVGGEVVKGLEEKGLGVRPEEVETAAAGDPMSLWAFGQAFGAAGKVMPKSVKAIMAKTGQAASELAPAIGGKMVQAAGKALQGAGIVTEKVAPVAPFVTAAKGASMGGPAGAIAGFGLGKTAQRAIAGVGEKIAGAGETVAKAGENIATGQIPVGAGWQQLGKDILQGSPQAIAKVAEGTALDVATAAVTSETPQETAGAMPFGTVIGLGAGAAGMGRRVISGQLAAPRNWGRGQATIIPPSAFPNTLGAMTKQATAAAAPGVQARISAIHYLLSKVAPGVELVYGPDAATLEQNLVASGVAPETAKMWAAQEGLFSRDITDAKGNPKKIVVAKDIEAAPHESTHAIQDVVGESVNRGIDELVKKSYTPAELDAFGQEYADQIAKSKGEAAPANWREYLADATGWGHADAIESLVQQMADREAQQTGVVPGAEAIKESVKKNWTGDYRDILTPEQVAAAGERYALREIAGENFDASVKATGADFSDTSLPAKLARLSASVITAMGGDPLAGRKSDFRGVPLRLNVMEAITGQAKGLAKGEKPTVAPKAAPAKPTVSPRAMPRTQEEQQGAAEEARTLAEAAPEAPEAAGMKSPRELLGTIAEAIAGRLGLKINYRSAPGEPAGAITSNRTARREVIEMFRSMPEEARALWEKNFFAERVLKTKDGKYQVMGWAPEVFAANAHKVARALAEAGALDLTPYEIDPATKTFTPDAWRRLYDDTARFVANQEAGRTGAGERLVVPEDIQARGFFKPAEGASSGALPQGNADFINLLFNFKIPETPRMQKGKLPVNIAAQEVSAATMPGRVESPVRPRGAFTGEEAARQGVEGRAIAEVNPLRNQMEARLGTKMPSLIEAIQKINLEHIADVVAAPELPQFRGNTLTLSAGFQPSIKPLAEKGKEWRITGRQGGLSKELKIAAPDMAEARRQAEKQGMRVERVTESIPTDRQVMFQPPKTVDEAVEVFRKITPDEFMTMSRDFSGGYTKFAHDLGRGVKTPAEVEALFSAAKDHQARSKEAQKADDFDAGFLEANLSQLFREAFEAATDSGSAGVTLRKETGYKAPFPELARPTQETPTAQFMPGLVGVAEGADEISFRKVPDVGSTSSTHMALFGQKANWADRWRYLPSTKTLYWWDRNAVSSEVREATKSLLESKGMTVDSEKNLSINDTRTWAESHGVQFQARTEFGKAKEAEGFEFRLAGGPGNRSVELIKDGANIGTIVSAQIEGKKSEVWVDRLSVDGKFRGKGLGEAMYRELMTQLKDDGVKTVGGMIVHEAPISIREKVFGPGKSAYEVGGEPATAEQAREGVREMRETYASKPFSAVQAESKITKDSQFQPKRAEEETPPLYDREAVTIPLSREKIQGGKVSAPVTTYDEAVRQEGNPWVRRSADIADSEAPTNAGRTLLVQFASDILTGGLEEKSAEGYYGKLYAGAREGFYKLPDFWEIPQWVGFMSHMLPNADFYVVRDMAAAKEFFKEAGYDRLAFSSLDTNQKFIRELAQDYPGKIDVGGFGDPKFFEGLENVKWHDSMKSWAKEAGVEYAEGVDYRHFAGSQVIPRLTLSNGCKHKCAFCSVPKTLTVTPPEVVKQQADAISELGAKLVYLNDKTFGQAPNYQSLSEVNAQIKAKSPDFKGFIVQTTAAQLMKLPTDWLKESGIRFVELGIESYNDPILREMKKPATEALIDRATNKLREAGIALIPNIIIGFPQETAETYARTLDFLKSNEDIISHANIYNLGIFKNTELAKKVVVASDADFNENVLEKSFHENPEVHRVFAGKVYGLASEMLEGQPKSAQWSVEKAARDGRDQIKDMTELWTEKREKAVPLMTEKKEKATPLMTEKREKAPGDFEERAFQSEKKDHPTLDDASLRQIVQDEIKADPEGYKKAVDEEMPPGEVQAQPPKAEDLQARLLALKKEKQAEDFGEVSARWEKPTVAPPATGEKRWRLTPGGADGISKAWVLPDGQPMMLGATWHHDALARSQELQKKYDIDVPNFTGADTEGVREMALQKGFVRVNYLGNSGTLVVEARQKDWRKQRQAIFDLVDANAGRIDNLEISLFNETADRVVKSTRERLFEKDDSEKATAVMQAQPARMESKVLDEELAKIRGGKSGGQTFANTGDVWTPKDTKVDLVTLASVNVPAGKLTREAMLEALGAYSDLLDEPNVVAGVFAFSKDGIPTASIDLNAIVPQKFRENTKAFAKANDQVSLWDVAKTEEVKTGGSGDTKLKSLGEISDALDALVKGDEVSIADIIKEHRAEKMAEELTLPGMEVTKSYNAAAISKMTKAELAQHFPEAVIPRGRTDILDSEITKSPLYKAAGSEAAAVESFAKRLVEFAEEAKRTTPEAFDAGSTWYSSFVPMLKKAFGKSAGHMAELLAATSPQTDPAQNFAYAIDALRSWESGRFDKQVTKFNEGMEKVADGSWEKYYQRDLKAGLVKAPPETPSSATFIAHWIDKFDLKPRRATGKLYGKSSNSVLQVMARRWMQENAGPKTRNFVENLQGIGHDATIDLWADRTMRRVGYAGSKERWRILPKNQAGVSDVDFAFSQKVFRSAAEKLGMKADDLQGALWFAEKTLWSEKGWGRLDLGDYRTEMKKLPLYEAEMKRRLAKAPKAKESTQEEFGLVVPRKLK